MARSRRVHLWSYRHTGAKSRRVEFLGRRRVRRRCDEDVPKKLQKPDHPDVPKELPRKAYGSCAGTSPSLGRTIDTTSDPSTNRRWMSADTSSAVTAKTSSA